MKRDTISVDNTRKELHVRVLKYLSGRYQSIPAMQTLDQDSIEEESTTTTEGSTTMEAYVQAPTPTASPDDLNTKIFGGYFSSILGNSLAHHFNVTTKIQSTPPYIMLHYFFKGNATSPNGTLLGEANLIPCDDLVQFCPKGSNLVCARNGTVYCLALMTKTVLSTVEGFKRPSLQTKVIVRCWRKNVEACEKAVPVHIPCYATITMVEGDERAVNKVYKDKHCIIIVGHPVPKYSNSEFMDYVKNDEEGQRVLNHQISSLTDVILKQMFL